MLGVLGSIFFIIFFFLQILKELNVSKLETLIRRHILDLHCLPMSNKKDARLPWVISNYLSFLEKNDCKTRNDIKNYITEKDQTQKPTNIVCKDKQFTTNNGITALERVAAVATGHIFQPFVNGKPIKGYCSKK